MLVEISGNRLINPFSDNIIGIFPNEGKDKDGKIPYHSYVLNIGCHDGIGAYYITKDDRDVILNATRDEKRLKNEVR